jgi:Multiubiquitin
MSSTTAAKPKPKPVTILVNNRPVELPDRDTTGREIKVAAEVPLEFTLYEKKGNQLREIADDDEIKVNKNDEFIAVSGQDVS